MQSYNPRAEGLPPRPQGKDAAVGLPARLDAGDGGQHEQHVQRHKCLYGEVRPGDGHEAQDLLSRGIEVSEVFHLAGGRIPGPDPQGRSYQTYASFNDPDGNEWQLQEITTRLPGREWEV